MLAKTYSSIVIGIDAYTIEIEANVSTTQRGAENILSIISGGGIFFEMKLS